MLSWRGRPGPGNRDGATEGKKSGPVRTGPAAGTKAAGKVPVRASEACRLRLVKEALRLRVAKEEEMIVEAQAVLRVAKEVRLRREGNAEEKIKERRRTGGKRRRPAEKPENASRRSTWSSSSRRTTR